MGDYMNKKGIMIFTLMLTLFLMLGSVNASLVEHNFDNDFSMEVPSDSNFVLQPIQDDEDASIMGNEKVYLDENNLLFVLFVEGSMISDDNVDGLYEYIFEVINPGITNYWESQSDGMKVFKPKGHTDEYFSMVGTHSGNKTVIVFGDDTSLLIKMTNTTKFN